MGLTRLSETLKTKIRERDGYTCQMCGKTGGPTVYTVWRTVIWTMPVHRIDGDKRNEDPSNLCVLCKSCLKRAPDRRAVWAPVMRAKVAAKYEENGELVNRGFDWGNLAPAWFERYPV